MKIAFAMDNIGKWSKGPFTKGKLRRGGAERVLIELANELSKRGHEITIFCNDVDSRDEFMYPTLPQVQYCDLREVKSVFLSNPLEKAYNIVQCHSLLEVKSVDFINRTKSKFVRNIIIWKWKLYNIIQQLQNLLQFRNLSSNKPSKPSSDNKKPSRLNQHISRQNWKLDYLLYKYVLNCPRVIKQNYDVFVLFPSSKQFFHKLSMLLSKNRNFPIIYSFHTQVRFCLENLSSTNLAELKKILELTDLILVLLPEFIDELPEPLQNKTLSIPNPIKSIDKHKRANPGLNTGLKTILAVGRLAKQKNHKILLEAFARLTHKHPDWQVKIFGDGEIRKELTDLIHELELADKVFLMGITEAIHEEYQKAQILAMPSKFEGFPNALSEGIAHGLPAVGFDNAGGVNFLIQHGYNGLLANGNNPVENLASCLEQLMTNPELRVKLGQNGIEFIKPFDPKNVYDLWEKTILEAKHNFNKVY